MCQSKHPVTLHRSRQTLLEADWSADSRDVLFDISASAVGLRCRRITVNRLPVLVVENDYVCISPSDKGVMCWPLYWFDCQMITQEGVDKFSCIFWAVWETFRLQQRLHQWCTNSGPRAKSGPRRVARWPTGRTGKFKIWKNGTSFIAYGTTLTLTLTMHFFLKNLDLNDVIVFLCTLLQCRPCLMFAKLCDDFNLHSFVAPRVLRILFVALGRKSLCTAGLDFVGDQDYDAKP